MLYEKKMLILTGDGKGVVLIEKSAVGVRFSLSTFDMPICGELKAGVITPTEVFVRDLPQTQNPSSVFLLNLRDISELHFAVFDERLRLYGTNCKRMWEANVMGLLKKNDRRSSADESPSMPALPPIAKAPEVLPMPDGTGLPQSRLAIYGDDTLAESDFYTPLDFSARMPAIDRFLDEPRLTESLAPRVLPKPVPLEETTAAADDTSDSEQTPVAAEAEQAESVTDEQPQPIINEQIEPKIEKRIDSDADEQSEPKFEQQAEFKTEEQSEPTVAEQSEPKTEEISERMTDEQSAQAAATADAATYEREMPWQMQARWIRNRAKRVIMPERSRVKPIGGGDKVKFLRDVAFIERARADIEKLFKNAERDDRLCALLPDIEWVKVETDGHIISVGRGGNEFLCYAVAGSYSKTSPVGEEAQWLPADKNLPTGSGYWLIFQSLATGKIIGGI